MNKPSMKFVNDVIPGGHILLNSSLIDTKVERNDVYVAYISDELAVEIGMPKVANMIILGACLKVTESVLKAFLKVFGEKNQSLYQ